MPLSLLYQLQRLFTYGIDFDLPAIGNQWHSWPRFESIEDVNHLLPSGRKSPQLELWFSPPN